jgi:hypothetical protein
MQRWHFRVERLARMLDRPTGELASELKQAAKDEAARRRREMESRLAQDLAVYQAQGRPVSPPWRRRLQTLAEISGEACDAVEERISEAASAIQVVVAAN